MKGNKQKTHLFRTLFTILVLLAPSALAQQQGKRSLSTQITGEKGNVVTDYGCRYVRGAGNYPNTFFGLDPFAWADQVLDQTPESCYKHCFSPPGGGNGWGARYVLISTISGAIP